MKDKGHNPPPDQKKKSAFYQLKAGASSQRGGLPSDCARVYLPLTPGRRTAAASTRGGDATRHLRTRTSQRHLCRQAGTKGWAAQGGKGLVSCENTHTHTDHDSVSHLSVKHQQCRFLSMSRITKPKAGMVSLHEGRNSCKMSGINLKMNVMQNAPWQKQLWNTEDNFHFFNSKRVLKM